MDTGREEGASKSERLQDFEKGVHKGLQKAREIELDKIAKKSFVDASDIRDTLDELVPQVKEMGKQAIPFLTKELGGSPSEELPLTLQHRFEGNPLLAYTEPGREYIAHFIDGHADLDDLDPVLEVLGADTIFNSPNGSAANVLLYTTERLTFPLRKLQEQHQLSENDTRLEKIAGRLIELYDQNPDHTTTIPGLRRDERLNAHLLRAIALTGTENAKAFVTQHLSQSNERMLTHYLREADTLTWDDFRQYDFSTEFFSATDGTFGELFARFKPGEVSSAMQEKLMSQAKGEGSDVESKIAVPVEPSTATQVDAIRGEVAALESPGVTQTRVLAPEAPAFLDTAQQSDDVNVDSSSKNDISRRGFMKGMAGLIGVGAGLFLGKVKAPGLALSPETIDAPSSELTAVPNIPLQEVSETTQNTLDDVLKNAEVVTLGEGATISESLWTSQGKDQEWWLSSYWYHPDNLGAFILANHDALEDAFHARSSVDQVKNTFPDGYPSTEQILHWIEQANEAATSMGINTGSQTTAYQGRENDLNQIDPLISLREAVHWVETGTKIKVIDPTHSDTVISYFKNPQK